jgi:glycosyltransferase involved in cell wall biosynthesis
MRATTDLERPGAAAAPGAARVLVPYIATYPGGVRTVLGLGLPRLAAAGALDLTYAELCRNEADMAAMERAGVAVDRTAGVPGPAALSLHGGRLAGVSRAAPRLARVAWRLSRRLGAYDAVWVHGHRELLLVAAARALLPRREWPALVWHWHGPPLSLEPGPRGSWGDRAIAALGSRVCDRVIAISAFCAGQTARMGVDPARVATVLNAAQLGTGPAPAAPLPDRRPGDFVALLPCASLRPHKGVHVAVEALRALPPRHVLWVTGDPGDPAAAAYVADLEARVRRGGLEARVAFLGVRRDLHAVMGRADAVVVPSVWDEPFGLVAAEAQLAGVPVIASRRGALPEIVGGAGGLLVDPDEPSTLAAALRDVERGAGRGAAAEAARRQAEARYSYDRWAREVAAVIAGAAAARRSRPRRDRP